MDTDDFSFRTLSEKERNVAYEIVRGGRETEEILTEYGVSDAEFTKWVTGGVFPSYTAHLAEAFAGAKEPFVWAKLLSLIHDGNIQAIKLFFSLKDRKKEEKQSVSVADCELNELREDIFGEEEGEK